MKIVLLAILLLAQAPALRQFEVASVKANRAGGGTTRRIEQQSLNRPNAPVAPWSLPRDGSNTRLANAPAANIPAPGSNSNNNGAARVPLPRPRPGSVLARDPATGSGLATQGAAPAAGGSGSLSILPRPVQPSGSGNSAPAKFEPAKSEPAKSEPTKSEPITTQTTKSETTFVPVAPLE